MHINRMPIYITLVALAVLLCPCLAVTAADQPQNGMILELDDSILNNSLAEHPFFILDYYEPGCDPCLRMNASLHELSLELKDQATFGMINAIKNDRSAQSYNVTAYPTLLVFKNGTLAEKSVGFGSKAAIVDTLLMLKPDLNTSHVTYVEASADLSEAVEQKMNCSDIKKLQQPVMQAFVVSYCPFGLQMQRALSGIVDQIPALSQNIKVRYIVEMADGNVTSMHGQTESNENLRQICMREEQPEKYWKYISCFLESGNFSQCIKTVEVDEVKLNGCLADERRSLMYARDDFNKTQEFSITGSPTLIMNGQIVSESDFGGRTEQAIKNLLCCGFNIKPDTCSINLSTEEAIAGFPSDEDNQPSDQTNAQAQLKEIPLTKLSENKPALPIILEAAEIIRATGNTVNTFITNIYK